MKLLLTVWEEIGEFFAKNIGLLIGLLMGTAAKIALESKTRRLTFREWIIIVVLSCFVGYLGSEWMNRHGYESQTNWAVPIITLLGESIVMWLVKNSKRIINAIAGVVFPTRNSK